MRAPLIIVIIATVLLSILAYATFGLTSGLDPLPLAARGAIAAAIMGACGLFAFFLFLQRRQRHRDRNRNRDQHNT